MPRFVSPLDAAWLALESPQTPMHVGALFEFVRPVGASADYMQDLVARLRGVPANRSPWNLRLVNAPVLGKVPLMTEVGDVDLTYHVRHSALPAPGGQRELGVLVSRLHGHQLDFRRPLWELHVIEGLGDERFAVYVKMHHAIIDGVSGIRMFARAFAEAPDAPDAVAFWGTKLRSVPRPETPASTSSALLSPKALRSGLGRAGDVAGLGRAGLELGLAAISGRGPQAPFRAPSSALSGRVSGSRRVATQRFDLETLKRLAKATDCTLNDVVLMLSGSALRQYLREHGRLPDRSLTAGIPVSLRDATDQRTGGTSISIMVATLGTNVSDPEARLEAIKASTATAKRHLQRVPVSARSLYPLFVSGPWIGGLVAGMGGRAPVPFNVAISNVPGPAKPMYFHGSRLDAVFPLSLLLHGNALNITCVSNDGKLNFGFTGARNNLPHLQRLALYAADAMAELEAFAGHA